jgi:TRAP transporter TAXI family solute receptor
MMIDRAIDVVTRTGGKSMRGALLRIAAVLLLALVFPGAGRADESDWPQTLVIGTASPGGTYYAYGEGLAHLLSRKLGRSVITRPTEGPTENLKLLETNEIQLAFVTLGIAQQGWNGTGDWTNGQQLRAARALFPMYDTPFHFIVMSDSEVRSIADLSGKRVGIGPQGGTGGIYSPLVFKALKMEASFASGSWTDLAAQFSARQLEALIVLGGVPVPEVAELEKKGNVRYLTLTPNQVVALRLALPELSSSLIAAGTYPSLRRHYRTLGMYNFAVARANLPNDLAYAILEAVFNHHEEMMEIHPAAAETVPSNFTRNTILPFHDGAARWYNNKAIVGVSLAD